MAINLRVVGLYINTSINVTETQLENYSVLDLLESAHLAGLLNYQLDMKGSVAVIQRHVRRAFGPTKGKKYRTTGTYAIEEIRTEASSAAPGTLVDRNNPASRVQAWQYYIERPRPLKEDYTYTKFTQQPDGTVKETKVTVSSAKVLISATTPGEGFNVPDASEKLEDGDSVIWRCISILTGPSGSRIQ